MFNVYDNGRLAKYPEVKIHPSWDKASFNTLQEAQAYANRYFNPYPAPNGLEKIDYSGYGDTAEIREE